MEKLVETINEETDNLEYYDYYTNNNKGVVDLSEAIDKLEQLEDIMERYKINNLMQLEKVICGNYDFTYLKMLKYFNKYFNKICDELWCLCDHCPIAGGWDVWESKVNLIKMKYENKILKNYLHHKPMQKTKEAKKKLEELKNESDNKR